MEDQKGTYVDIKYIDGNIKMYNKKDTFVHIKKKK